MPLQVLAEKTRQALGGVSSSSTFQPISLERYHHALADADKFAAWLQDYHGTAAQLQAALQGFLGATSTAVSTCPLPSLYSERYDTHELRALPHPPPPKGYSHLFTSTDAGTSPRAGAAAATSANLSTSNTLSGLPGLPAAFPDKFEGHVMVPIELWLQAHKEAQARLSALDRLRVRVDTQRLKLHKQGQIYEQRKQERKQRTHSGSTSNRSSFERSPAAHFNATSFAVASANGAAAAGDSRAQHSFSNQVANSPPNLAAAAAAALASRPDLIETSTTVTSNDDSMVSQSATDPGLLTTPPCSPLVSASNLAAGFDPQQLPSRDTTAAAAAAGAHTVDGQAEGDSSRGGGDRGMNGYAEGSVRLNSVPLVDAPTSVASSSNSRRNSAERAAQGTPAAAAAAASPKEPTMHAALPVLPAAGGGAASVSPLRQPAAAPTASPAAATAKDGGVTGGVSPKGVPASGGADSAAEGGRGTRFSEDRLTGLDDEDLESWAAAVLHRRGEQGLLQAHEMVERALGPLLSEFSKAEMQLSLLLGWLVTQAVRLRGYLAHILLSSEPLVTSWGPPPGLLEPFPADILLTGDGNHHSHHKTSASKHAAAAAAAAAGVAVEHTTVGPPAPLPELPLVPQQLLPKQMATSHTSSTQQAAPHGSSSSSSTQTHQQHDAEAHSTAHKGAARSGVRTPAAASGSPQAGWLTQQDASPTRPPNKTADADVPAPAVQPPAVQPPAVQPPAVQALAVHTQSGGTARARRSVDLHATSTTVPHAAAPPSPAAVVSDAAHADGHKGSAGSPTPKTLPQPASSSTLSVGSAMLAAMVRSMSWKSNNSGPGLGRASRASSGSSGKSGSKEVTDVGSKDILHSVLPKGVPLGEGVLAVSPRGDATASQGFAEDSSAGHQGPSATAAHSTLDVQGGVAAGELSAEGAAAMPASDVDADAGLVGAASSSSRGTATTGAAGTGTGALGSVLQSPAGIASSGAESSGASAAPGVSTADMTYLAQDRALIESLSEQVLWRSCSSTSTSGTAAAAAASPAAAVTASAGAAVAGEHRSHTDTAGDTTHSAGLEGLSATATAAEGGYLGVGQGTTGFGALQLGHRRQQLLQRAVELDAESAQHAAAAEEAGRMAAAYYVEGSECETSLMREVVVERRKLQERLEAVHVQLSEVRSGEVPRLRAAAALLTTQLADLGQQMSALASQEIEAGEVHSGLMSRRAAATSALSDLDLQSESLQDKMKSTKSVLSSKYEVLRALEVEGSRLQELLSAAEEGRAEAQEGLAARKAQVDAGSAELSAADSELATTRAKLTQLVEVELVQLQQEMKDIQVRLHEVQFSEHRAQADADLQDLKKQLDLDKAEVAANEATCLEMSSRLSELAIKAATLSRNVATFNAQAVAAKGLERAEKARAAAAGAEAEALQAAAAAIKSSQDSWSASYLTTSTTSTVMTREQQTAAVTATNAASAQHSSGSSSTGVRTAGSAAPASAAALTTSPIGHATAADSIGDAAAGGDGAEGAVPNRLAAAGPLQQVSSPTAAAAAAVTSGEQQEQLASAREGSSMADSATQTSGGDVTAAAAEDRVVGSDACTAVAAGGQPSSTEAEVQAVDLAESGTQTPGSLETAGTPAAAPTAAPVTAPGASPLRHGPAAAEAHSASPRVAVLASGTREAVSAHSTRPHIVPGSRAHVVSDTVPTVHPAVSSGARAAATTVPPAVSSVEARPEISSAADTAHMISSSTGPIAAASAGSSAAVARPESAAGAASANRYSAGAAGMASGSGLQQTVSPVSPGSVSSVGSSSRERGHKQRGLLRHFKVQKARPEDHFYLPLGGMDVDIGRMTDQDTRTPPHLTAPPAATPAALPTAALAPTSASTAPAPAIGPLAGAPSPAAAHQTSAAMNSQVPPALTSPQYAAHSSSSSSSGPLGGREPRVGSMGSVDRIGPDRLTGPGGPVAGPGVKTGTRLVVAAAPAGSDLGSGDTAQYHTPELGRQDQGVHGHKGRKHRHRADGVNGVMGGGLGGEGVTQAGGYVPGPLEAAGDGWKQDMGYEGYGGRGY